MKALYALAFAGALFSFPVHASVITQTESFVTRRVVDLTFDKFDASLGTLTGVTYTIRSRYDVPVFSFSASGRSPGPYRFDVGVTQEFRVQAPSAFSEGIFEQAGTCSGVYGPQGEGSTCTGSIPSRSLVFDDVFSASDLTLYIGMPGDKVVARLNFSTTIRVLSTSFNIVSSSSGSSSSSWLGDLTLEYEYIERPATAVPEPGGMAALGAGLVGIALTRKIRRNRT